MIVSIIIYERILYSLLALRCVFPHLNFPQVLIYNSLIIVITDYNQL